MWLTNLFGKAKNLNSELATPRQKKVRLRLCTVCPEKRNDFVSKPQDLQMVIEYFTQQGIANPSNSAKKFFDHYEANGWFRGKTKIKRWRSCLTQWDFEKKSSHSDGFIYECPNCKKFRTKAETTQLWSYCPTCNEKLIRVFE